MNRTMHRSLAAVLGLFLLGGCGNEIHNVEAEGAVPIAVGSVVEITLRADTVTNFDQQQIKGVVKKNIAGWVVLDVGGKMTWVRTEAIQKIRIDQAARGN